MCIVKLLCLALIIFSSPIYAMEQEITKPESLVFLMDALTVNSVTTTNLQELTLLLHSMNLHQTKTKFERIANLAFTLNLCLIKDSGYYKHMQSTARELEKAELAHITRETLKNIVRITKQPSPNISLLEQTIHQIHCFKIQYVSSTQGLPSVIEDVTSRYKEEMLAALAR